VATTDDGGIQLHQLVSCSVGEALRVETDYPWSGEVVVRVREPGSWRLSLRVPSWADDAVLVDRGERRPVGPGYATADGPWRAGDELRLELPLAPRWTRPDPRIDAVRGCVALERGPLVYCLESTDQEDGFDLTTVTTAASDALTERAPAATLGGAVPVEARDLTFIPYHAWGNRGLSTMRVWVPEAEGT